MEAKKRLNEVKSFNENDKTKFTSIRADFENNTTLYKKNYKTKIDELKIIQEEREKTISEMNNKAKN